MSSTNQSSHEIELLQSTNAIAAPFPRKAMCQAYSCSCSPPVAVSFLVPIDKTATRDVCSELDGFSPPVFSDTCPVGDSSSNS